jgi:hypothetical protein
MLACWAFTKRQWTLAGVVYALSLGVKMNALLYFPGIVVVFILAAGRDQTVRSVLHILQVQVRLPFEVVDKRH